MYPFKDLARAEQLTASQSADYIKDGRLDAAFFTVALGAMTIPLMKKVGFRPHTVGAVEVAASTNGQLMPPIMGAAAFIMAEIIGISYIEIVKAAFIPALLSYTAIFSIVHLEAVKENIRGLTREETPPMVKTFLSGIHFLVPLAILIWLLLFIRWTPTTAASWSILAGALVAIGNNIHKQTRLFPQLMETSAASDDPGFKEYSENPGAFFFNRSKKEILDSLETGARNMAGIAAACACCGIIIGVVTLTGLGLKMATLITEAAGGNLFLTLIFSVYASIILGMGLPTTATYFIQGYWVTKTLWIERFIFIGLAFILVNPGSITLLGIHINPHASNCMALVTMAAIFFMQRVRKAKERETGALEGAV